MSRHLQCSSTFRKTHCTTKTFPNSVWNRETQHRWGDELGIWSFHGAEIGDVFLLFQWSSAYLRIIISASQIRIIYTSVSEWNCCRLWGSWRLFRNRWTWNDFNSYSVDTRFKNRRSNIWLTKIADVSQGVYLDDTINQLTHFTGWLVQEKMNF